MSGAPSSRAEVELTTFQAATEHLTTELQSLLMEISDLATDRQRAHPPHRPLEHHGGRGSQVCRLANFMQFVGVTPADNIGIALNSSRGSGFVLCGGDLDCQPRSLARMPPRGYAPWGHPSLRSLGCQSRLPISVVTLEAKTFASR